LQKNVPNNLKLVAANSVYDVGGTLAQPRKSIGGCPKMQARSLHGNRNTICFAALEKHNRDWRRPMIAPFPPNPLRIFHHDSVPRIIVEGETGLWSRISIARWKRSGKIKQISGAGCRF
jgi:hypothetical protein